MKHKQILSEALLVLQSLCGRKAVSLRTDGWSICREAAGKSKAMLDLCELQ